MKKFDPTQVRLTFNGLKIDGFTDSARIHILGRREMNTFNDKMKDWLTVDGAEILDVDEDAHDCYVRFRVPGGKIVRLCIALKMYPTRDAGLQELKQKIVSEVTAARKKKS